MLQLHKSRFIIGAATTLLVMGCGGGGSPSEESSGGTGGASDTITISYKGLTYKAIKSPETNRTWLDRNLGAEQACESFDDVSCYGDYYQWGRGSDGHEKIGSSTQDTKISNIESVNSKFVIGGTEWTTDDTNGTKRKAYWGQKDGSSVCPDGFRVPTFNEIFEEVPSRSTSNLAVFESFIKLPSAGVRWPFGGSLLGDETQARVWSSDFIVNDSGVQAKGFTFSDVGRTGFIGNTSYGIPIRCIKN